MKYWSVKQIYFIVLNLVIRLNFNRFDFFSWFEQNQVLTLQFCFQPLGGAARLSPSWSDFRRIFRIWDGTEQTWNRPEPWRSWTRSWNRSWNTLEPPGTSWKVLEPRLNPGYNPLIWRRAAAVRGHPRFNRSSGSRAGSGVRTEAQEPRGGLDQPKSSASSNIPQLK